MAGLFGGTPASPPAPKPTRMPVQDNAALAAARRRAEAASRRRSGRLSTVLTDALRSITGSVGKLGR